MRGPGTPRNLYGNGSRPGCTTHTSPEDSLASAVIAAAATSSGCNNGNPESRNNCATSLSNGVSTYPGQTAWIRIPNGSSNAGIDRTSPTTACLVIEYTGSSG